MSRLSAPRHRILTASLLAVTALGGSVALSACSGNGSANHNVDVTYRISVDGARDTALQGVAYNVSAQVGSKPVRVDAGTVATTPSGQSGTGVWEQKAQIVATGTAEITGTPSAGARATCQIIGSDDAILATATGEAGKPITCTATVPDHS